MIMSRYLAIAAAMLAALCPCGRSSAAFRNAIIPKTTAVRHGLTRAWFTQISMDSGRARVQDIVLYDGTLYVQTNRAMVHAIDAETGATIWAKRIGRINHPSMAPGLSQDLVGVVNGSRLYVVNRYNGELLYETQVDGAPGAGPALSEQWAYVPMITGLVVAYRLKPITDPMVELGKIKKDITDEEKAQLEEERRENIELNKEYVPPLSCHSDGRALIQPLVTRQNKGEEFVAWPTDRGYLHIGSIDRRSNDRLWFKYRLETGEGIAARPSYLPPDPDISGETGVIYAASRDGSVHAIAERNGEVLWRFSTSVPIHRAAVVIDQRVYVVTQPGGMYCIDSRTGDEIWWAPRIGQFVAASKQRIYAADKLGNVLVLNAKTGTRLDSIAAVNLPVRLSNSQTDRIYLGTNTGLIQCLHEIELTKPLDHDEARKKRLEEHAKPAVQQKGIEQLQRERRPDARQDLLPEGEDPFGGAEDGEDPFGGAEDGGGAGGDVPGGEDPFGAADGAGGGAAPPADAGGGAAPGGGGAIEDDPFGGL